MKTSIIIIDDQQGSGSSVSIPKLDQLKSIHSHLGGLLQEQIVLPHYYEGTVTWPVSATKREIIIGCALIVRYMVEKFCLCTFTISNGGHTATFKTKPTKESSNVDNNWDQAVASDHIVDGHQNGGIKPVFQQDSRETGILDTYEGTVVWPVQHSVKARVACIIIKDALLEERFSCTYKTSVDGSTGSMAGTFIFSPILIFHTTDMNTAWDRALAADILDDGHIKEGVRPLMQESKSASGVVMPNRYEGKVAWPPADTAEAKPACTMIYDSLIEKGYACTYTSTFNGSTGYTTIAFNIWCYAKTFSVVTADWNSALQTLLDGSTGYTTAKFNIQCEEISKSFDAVKLDWEMSLDADILKDEHLDKGFIELLNSTKNAENMILPPAFGGRVAWSPAYFKYVKPAYIYISISDALRSKGYLVDHQLTANGSTGYTTSTFNMLSLDYYKTLIEARIDWESALATDTLDDGHVDEGVVPVSKGTKAPKEVVVNGNH